MGLKKRKRKFDLQRGHHEIHIYTVYTVQHIAVMHSAANNERGRCERYIFALHVIKAIPTNPHLPQTLTQSTIKLFPVVPKLC